MGYISAQGASNLANYKYSGVDNSVLARLFFSKFWNSLIEYVPRNIAPNLLTLCGLLSVLSMYLLMWCYCSEGFEGIAPGWVYFAVAFLVFAYQTLDNLDGKQARRTGTSSALGEAFDHGGDSLTTMLFSMTIGTALQFGSALTFMFQILLICVFYGCHWEAYFTGTLLLRPLDNPTEAQWCLIGLLVITGLAGPLFWLTEVNVMFLGPVQLNHIIFFIYVVGSINSCLDNFSKVSEHFQNLNASKVTSLLCLAPVTLLVLLSILCVWFSPSVLVDHPRLFMSATGLLFSYLQIRLIIQNVCKEPFKPYYNVISPLILFTFNCFLESRGGPILDTSFLVQVYFLYALGVAIYIIISVVNELSTILNIKVFVINPPPLGRA